MSQLEHIEAYEVLPINDVQEGADGDEKSCSSLEKPDIYSSEYELGRPTLKGEGQDFLQPWVKKRHHSDSGCESISDEELEKENTVLSNFSYTYGPACVHETSHPKIEIENQDEACMWSGVLVEADKLVSLQKKTYNSSATSDSSEARKIPRGGGGKAKLKFSIRSHSHKELCCPSAKMKTEHSEHSYQRITKDAVLQEKIDSTIRDKSMAELLGNLQQERNEVPVKILFYEETAAAPSMAEMLEDLQEKNGQIDKLPQNVKTKQRKLQVLGKRTLLSLGTRNLDDEDPPEFMDGGISNDEEEIDQDDLNLAIENIKPQTMADIFQEAFITAETEERVFHMYKRAGTDYHARLQQIMQIEKDRHLEFLKQLQTGQSSSCELRCIDVRILSRVLEAKLTVCHCLFGENAENSQCQENPQCADSRQSNMVTIIFSTKLCDNVDLEIGNLIRIHPPWKEVHNNKDEKIVLCAYFSQIMVRLSNCF